MPRLFVLPIGAALSAAVALSAVDASAQTEQPPAPRTATPPPPESRPPTAGCAKDTDCKGSRVCNAGQCMAPEPSPPSPAPVPSTKPSGYDLPTDCSRNMWTRSGFEPPPGCRMRSKGMFLGGFATIVGGMILAGVAVPLMAFSASSSACPSGYQPDSICVRAAQRDAGGALLGVGIAAVITGFSVSIVGGQLSPATAAASIPSLRIGPAGAAVAWSF